MNSIIHKLSEIETAAASIVTHAESEKETLSQKMTNARQQFDEELAKDTRQKLDAIQKNLTDNMDSQLEQLKAENARAIQSLTREYETKHEHYAQEILKRITEV